MDSVDLVGVRRVLVNYMLEELIHVNYANKTILRFRVRLQLKDGKLLAESTLENPDDAAGIPDFDMQIAHDVAEAKARDRIAFVRA